MRGAKEQETGNLFATVFKGKTYTCYDKEALSWHDWPSTAGIPTDLTGKRVTVMQIDERSGTAFVELATDRTKNFDVKLDTLKK